MGLDDEQFQCRLAGCRITVGPIRKLGYAVAVCVYAIIPQVVSADGLLTCGYVRSRVDNAPSRLAGCRVAGGVTAGHYVATGGGAGRRP